MKNLYRKGEIKMMKRRDFIKIILSTGALYLGGSFISGCSGIKRNDTCEPDSSQKDSPTPDTVSKMILYYASLAPSGHNTQPWRVRIEDRNTWIIESDPDRKLPVVDPENRELLLSLGAFVENLSIAAGAMGWKSDVEVIAAGRFDRDVVRVNLNRDKPVIRNLENIKKRRTIKHGLMNREISSSDTGLLNKEAEGHLAYFPKGSVHASSFRDAAIANFRTQTFRRDAQLELIRWLRLDDLSVRKFRDGLSLEGMEITGIKGWFLRHFSKPEDFMKDSYCKQSIDAVSRLAGEGGGWMVISSPGEAVSDLITAGRRFQRMALSARELGIGIHPMTQMLEEKKGISGVATIQEKGVFPQFVLRAGYTDIYPEPVSLRRPVEWFTYSSV